MILMKAFTESITKDEPRKMKLGRYPLSGFNPAGEGMAYRLYSVIQVLRFGSPVLSGSKKHGVHRGELHRTAHLLRIGRWRSVPLHAPSVGEGGDCPSGQCAPRQLYTLRDRVAGRQKGQGNCCDSKKGRLWLLFLNLPCLLWRFRMDLTG